jgi:D-3-phosphoglycerate dehydrogenase
MKILVADRLELKGGAPGGLAPLEIVDRAGITPEELAEVLGDYDGLVVRSRTKVTAALIERGTRLRVIGRAGTGVDNIDVEAATRRGILVMNVPGGNSNAAAEHTIAMMMAVSRNVPAAHAALVAGRWEPSKFTGVEVGGKTLGVLGLGRIGLMVAAKARGLGMNVIGYDPLTTPEIAAQHSIELLTLDDVIAAADYVSVHVPLATATKHLIGAERLARAKRGVRIINCARGGIVDEAALAGAIRSGHVAGAALDVFETEPPGASPLFDLPQVVVTPHLGASTVEAQENVSRAILAQVGDYLAGHAAAGAVNGFVIDAGTREVIAPYLELAERLGRVAAGLHPSGGKVTARCYGHVTSVNARPLTAHFLKGYLSRVLGAPINELSAHAVARDRGMVIEELSRDEHRSFQSLLYFSLERDGARFSIAGTVFGKSSLRIVRIGNQNLDAIPEGWMLIVHNRDVPGIVGRLGTALGAGGVNIANMSLGRDPHSGNAVAVLNVDSKPSSSLLAHLRSQPDIALVDLVSAS